MKDLEFSIYTKQDFKNIFEYLGVQKNSIVCLQMDVSLFVNLIGKEQMIIEVLQEIVGEKGCIFMPTFSYSSLDPACLDSEEYPFSSWKEIRENMCGYDVSNSMSDVYKDASNLFLHFKNVYRSNHPVYSFAYWGHFPENILKPEINEPLTFSSSLALLKDEKAINLLIGVNPEKALLLQAMANKYMVGQTVVQRAFVKRKKNVTKSFLVTKANPSICTDLIEGCYVREFDLENRLIYSLSLASN